jgi:hypothetical protein
MMIVDVGLHLEHSSGNIVIACCIILNFYRLKYCCSCWHLHGDSNTFSTARCRNISITSVDVRRNSTTTLLISVTVRQVQKKESQENATPELTSLSEPKEIVLQDTSCIIIGD